MIALQRTRWWQGERKRLSVISPRSAASCSRRWGRVYENDAVVRQRGLSPDERLRFHQEQSGPIMDKLERWLRQQIDEHKVEPNSGLGGAGSGDQVRAQPRGRDIADVMLDRTGGGLYHLTRGAHGTLPDIHHLAFADDRDDAVAARVVATEWGVSQGGRAAPLLVRSVTADGAGHDLALHHPDTGERVPLATVAGGVQSWLLERSLSRSGSTAVTVIRLGSH
jgi:hypothetical protein